MKYVCNYEKCTGCSACMNICPKNAISMEKNLKDLGHVYPKIDEQKCIKCGLCKKTCPEINNASMHIIKKAYAAYSKDLLIHKTSSSGGIAYLISKKILQQKNNQLNLDNGVVYATTNFKNQQIAFERITTVENLEKIKGSKYVQSHIGFLMRQLKKDLEENKTVLFIGTPCQVAGIKNFLKKDYKNLYLIDLICHGVPSQHLLFEEIKNHISLNELGAIHFREESTSFRIYDKQNQIVYRQERDMNPYYYGFMSGYFFRPSCYECNFKTSKRCSDLTLGDFGKLDEHSKLKEDNGVSVILEITEKGHKLIQLIINEIDIEEASVNDVIFDNGPLHTSIKLTNERLKFRKVYTKTKDYNKSCQIVMKKHFIKQNIKKILRKIIEVK